MNRVRMHFFWVIVATSLCLVFVPSCSRAALGAALLPNTPTVQLKRYLAFTEGAASNAVAQGARIVQETRGLRAVVCPPAVAQALGLVEDIPVQVADSAANAQVLATRVQDLGLT